MPTDSKFKKLVRARMEQTGETYTQARNALKAEAPTPVEAPVAEPTTLDRIRAVLAEYPNLCSHGIYLPLLLSRDIEEDKAKFVTSREALLSSDGVVQVEACLAFLKPVRKVAINVKRERGTSSYSLKHTVEGWHRDRLGERIYVSNGALIVAARILGFECRDYPDTVSLNQLVGVSDEDCRAVYEGKKLPEWNRTKGFVRWLFAQTKRDDPVGDLADDAKADYKFPRHGSIEEVHTYLAFRGRYAEKAFKAARREWEQKQAKAAQPPT